ncbi:MAG: D-alanyl-D-alanine dipeptidase [Glaciecola sp.]|jgi:D-alanyl-D-alanine dipeptidase
MRKTLKSITIFSVGVSLVLSCSNSHHVQSETVETPEGLVFKQELNIPTADNILDYNDSLWSEIKFQEEGVFENMAYADTVNFMGRKIYPCARCFLRPEAATALKLANEIAHEKGLRLTLFDCYRPTKYQQIMFDLIKDSRYVAEPKNGGSMHNKGLAVDIALADTSGNLLDFGGEFDEFSERSHLMYKKLDSIPASNRVLLKDIMTQVGFTPYAYEWWHYSYKQVDYQLDDYVWGCN